jgi:cellulose 1,4-beta-cellobiosidase
LISIVFALKRILAPLKPWVPAFNFLRSEPPMFSLLLVVFSSSLTAGALTPEVHPVLNWQQCLKNGTCLTQPGSVVLDADWRWYHDALGMSCISADFWSPFLCPDPKTCSQTCLVEGVDYSGAIGATTNKTALTLKFVTSTLTSLNVGSRLYLLRDQTHYQHFKLKNREFAFSVDVSKLPCGVNGALYFVAMDEDGGASRFPLAKPGAQYGLGYCNAQCPADILFINGEANCMDWKLIGELPHGHYGSCCTTINVWDANAMATSFATHLCKVDGQYRCEGIACGGASGEDRYSGVCDEDGCDFNPWRVGSKTYFGPGLTLDSRQPFAVVTQFLTSDGTDTGSLIEIRRKYVQNGRVIGNALTNINGVAKTGSISQMFCDQQKKAFGDRNAMLSQGGFTALSKQLDRGFVLVLSIWDDYNGNMLWLDSAYPVGKDKSAPGVERGPCASSSGAPVDVEIWAADASVVFGNLRFGPINATY